MAEGTVCLITTVKMSQESPTSFPAPTYMASQIKGLSQLGRFGTPEGRFFGRIAGFGTFSWRDLKFGTRPRANLEVWYLQKPLGQIATRHFSGPRVPNRLSWPNPGYQTSRFAKIRGPKRIRGTKPPVLGRQVPSAQSWRDEHQISVPEEEQLIAVRPSPPNRERSPRRRGLTMLFKITR